MSPTFIPSCPAATLAFPLCWQCHRHFLTLRVPLPVPCCMLPPRLSMTISFPCGPLLSAPPVSCSSRPSILPVPSVCPSLHPVPQVMTRMSTSALLLPCPTPRLRTTPPSATAPSASAHWAFFPIPGDSRRSPPKAPLPASSCSRLPQSQAPFPLASQPCRPGC